MTQGIGVYGFDASGNPRSAVFAAPGVAPTTAQAAVAVAVTPDSLCPRNTYQAIGASIPSGNVSLTATGTTGFPVAYARRLVVGGSSGSPSLLYVQRAGDSGFTAYAVQAGQVLDGIFIAVGGSTTGTTGVTYVNAEC